MVKPTIVRGTYLNILMGDGASPEVFSPICGATVRNLNHVIETNDQYTRDCALPAAIPTRDVIVTGERWDLSFSGVLNRTQLSVIQAASGVKKNWRFEIAQPAGNAVYGGYYAGPGIFTGERISGDDGAFATIEGDILSDGTWTWTTVP